MFKSKICKGLAFMFTGFKIGALYMDIGKVSGVSFGRRYSSILKTEYLRGNLSPQVSKGLYGGKLTPTTVSLEHILPKSGTRINGKFVKGHTNLSNLALATRRNNSIRGNKPLKDFLTRRSSPEWNVRIATLPPGANAFGNFSIN